VRGRWMAASVAAAVLVTGTVVTAVAVLGRSDGATVGHTADAAAGTGSPTVDPTTGAPTTGTTAATATATATTPASPTTTRSATPTTTKPSKAATAAAKAAASGTASLAGLIKPGVTVHGVATWYRTDGGGACGFNPGGDPMTVAMNWSDYEGSKACGAYILVRAAGGATVTVMVNNECPAPCRVHQLDLSPQAFAKLADPNTGQLDVTWQLLSQPLSGPLSVRYKVGSSQYWCMIQVINHRNPVATLEVGGGSSWRQLSRTSYNYFVSPNGSGCGGPLRITDIYGQRLVVSALPVRPDAVQSTDLQFAGH
jgi:expansin (peptidoglycan-binding protein)